VTDEGKRKPPRFPRPVKHEDDTEPPPTERVPVLPPPPRTPREPFRLLTVDEVPRPSWLIPADFREQIQKILAGHNQILTTQRNMALQLDGYGKAVNERFNIFHQELALLRAMVVESDGRLDKVELTLAQKATAVGGALTKGAALTFLGGIITEYWPQYARFIAGILKAAGVSP
jgi:hypothetical protein